MGADRSGWAAARADGRARWLLPTATAGLAAVLLGLTAAAVWAAASADRAVREVQHLSAQRDAWVEARYQVAQEHSVAHAYLAKPGPKLRPALAEASRSLDVALGFLADRGEPDDAAAARLGGFLLLTLGYQRQLIRQAAASQHQALHDPLTGLPNRELFGDRVGQAIRSADRQLRPAALLLLDLDRFKDVNDTLGHHHGDRLLGEVAARLTGVLRQVDTVARLGGDEFAVLLPDVDAAGAPAVAEKLRAALHQPLTLDGVGIDLDASIGIAVYPDHGGDAAELLQHANVAMYAAKQTHAGFVIYDASVDQHSPRRLALLGGLRRALEATSWWCTTSPRPTCATAGVLGVEALVRWQHPDQVADRLAAWGVPAGCLMLEVTESAVMADPALALEVLSRLHALGVGLALSDAVIVRSTIDLGHNLGLHVVAEGVETRDAWEELRALGCDTAQGYHLGRPMPATDLERWLGQAMPDGTAQPQA